jgi:hypothetical protein
LENQFSTCVDVRQPDSVKRRMTLRVCEHAPQASHLFVADALAAPREPRNGFGREGAHGMDVPCAKRRKVIHGAIQSPPLGGVISNCGRFSKMPDPAFLDAFVVPPRAMVGAAPAFSPSFAIPLPGLLQTFSDFSRSFLGTLTMVSFSLRQRIFLPPPTGALRCPFI